MGRARVWNSDENEGKKKSVHDAWCVRASRWWREGGEGGEEGKLKTSHGVLRARKLKRRCRRCFMTAAARVILMLSARAPPDEHFYEGSGRGRTSRIYDYGRRRRATKYFRLFPVFFFPIFFALNNT